MEVIVKIEFGESVKNLFADLFKLVGQQPAVVVNSLPASDGAVTGQLKAEEAAKPEEQPAKPAATRTRAKAKPSPEPVAETPEQPEPENIPELPEDEQELSDPEPATDGPFVPRDKDGNELDHKKIQVIAMQKGLPAFKAALETVTSGTVKALRDLEGQNMQRVYNFLMQQPNAK